jgi:amphi-Trp domain-containing protein
MMSVDHDVEKVYSVAEFVAQLRRLADALESGAPFSLEVEGEQVAVPVDAVLSVEHEREEGSEELEFQLSWKVEAEHDESEEDEEEEVEDEEQAEEEPTTAAPSAGDTDKPGAAA